MEIKETNAPEASEQNAPTEDNSNAAPAENESQEVIDPRIVEIVGEENIKSAFGDQPNEEEKPSDEVKEEEKEVVQDEEKKVVEKEEERAPEPSTPEYKPTRLDRRLANLYIHNLHLTGEKEIPSLEQVFADLKNYSKEEKIQAMHFHRLKGKELSGDTTSGDELEDEDIEAIQEAEREALRQEILAEEQEKQTKRSFIEFIDNHPELNEEKEEYNPTFAKAVATLWRGGMPIHEAFETVTKEIEAAKEAQLAEEKREKNKNLSGVVTGTGQVIPESKELTWEDVDRIQKENPAEYNRMLREGKFKHLT